MSEFMQINLTVLSVTGTSATITFVPGDKHDQGTATQDAYLLHLTLFNVLPHGTYAQLAGRFAGKPEAQS